MTNYETQDQDLTDVTNSLDTDSPETEEDQGLSKEISRLMASVNIAEDLEEEELDSIGADCKEGFEIDLKSRETWERDLEEWTKLAMQVRDPKTYPWPKASNVKYPLLSTAAMQFAARAYPSLVPSDGKVVKTKVIGKDPSGAKYERAQRVSTYMSYQIMYEMADWEEDMDKMLMMLPIIGTTFKKTYFDASEKKIKSCLLLPKNLVVNNWAKSLEDAERVSEIIEMSQRVLKERQRQKLFLDVDLGTPPTPDGGPYATNDETTPYTLVEQHTYLDLDDDGYPEPYVVTFHKESGQVLRIVARYELDNVEYADDEKTIIKITPTQYYTKFSFVPNPDGSFYGVGFGVLLGPLNESVNTLINQLIDAGTLSNLQSGFIGKGLRLKMGDQKFQPGEWKPVNATGDDLRKQIVPLPTRDPSNTLFELMGALVTSGKELASVAEIFTGKMPGQNTPATTTMATVEQGMKVFTAVYKRIYRSLEAEFKKIFQLNHIYLDPNTQLEILDSAIGPEDFTFEGYDVCPGADPTAVSQTEKLLKAQGLIELIGMFGPILDPIKVVSRVLEAQEQPNWQELFSQQVMATGQVPQQPDPKQLEMEMKMKLEQQKAVMKGEEIARKMELEARSKEQQMAMQAQEHNMEMQHKLQMNQVDAAIGIHKQRIFAAEGQQKLMQNEQAFQQKQQQAKESSKSLPKTSSANGGNPQSGKPSGKPSK